MGSPFESRIILTRPAILVPGRSETSARFLRTTNGELTLGENIGDLAGLTIAFKAYQISLDGREAPDIDDMTGPQRFFMGIAQVWWFKATEEAMRNRAATDPHSPPRFRVLGPLANMPEFEEAFDVKEGDGMYLPPEERVKIW